MANVWVNSITFFAEFLISLTILLNGYSVRKSILRTFLIGFAGYTVAFAVYFWGTNIYLNLLATLVVNLLFSYFCFNTNWRESIVNTVLITALMAISEFICLSIASSVLDVKVLNSDLHYFILFSVASKIIYLFLGIILIYFIKKLRNKKNRQNSDSPIYLFIYPISSIFSIFVYWMILDKNIISDTTKIYISISVVLIFFSVIITYAFYAYTATRNLEINRLKSELDKVKMEDEYYKLLDFQSENIKQMAHDEKNHLLVIKGMSDSDRINDYIDQIYSDLRKYTPKGLTDNKQLDFILNKYSVQCDAEKILFTTNIRTANLAFMKDTDLISLLSNLLDNAVEAASRSTEKRIDLSINMAMGMTVLTCINSCDLLPESKNMTLKTTKADKKSHGLGTKIIKRTSKKYEGEYTWRYDEKQKEFVTVIAFPK